MHKVKQYYRFLLIDIDIRRQLQKNYKSTILYEIKQELSQVTLKLKEIREIIDMLDPHLPQELRWIKPIKESIPLRSDPSLL